MLHGEAVVLMVSSKVAAASSAPRVKRKPGMDRLQHRRDLPDAANQARVQTRRLNYNCSIRACLQLGVKSEWMGIKSRTPFTAVTLGILESVGE